MIPNPYPYIARWGELAGYSPRSVEIADLVARAVRDKAPAGAMWWNRSSGTWETIQSIQSLEAVRLMGLCKCAADGRVYEGEHCPDCLLTQQESRRRCRHEGDRLHLSFDFRGTPPFARVFAVCSACGWDGNMDASPRKTADRLEQCYTWYYDLTIGGRRVVFAVGDPGVNCG